MTLPSIAANSRHSHSPRHRLWRVAGSRKFSLRRGADPQGIFQITSRWKGPGTVLEEGYLQDHRQAGRQCARILQVSQFSRATRVKQLGLIVIDPDDDCYDADQCQRRR